MVKENLIRMYEESFRTNAELPALTDYFKKTTLTYFQLAENVAKYHLVFEKYGIKAGDKIALIGRNTPKWVSIYASTLTYGAVIVPILQDFNPIDATNIINHSDSRILFLSVDYWTKLDPEKFEQLEAVVDYETMNVLWEKEEGTISSLYNNIETLFAERYPKGFSTEDIIYPEVTNDKVCIISYTSGTTGLSKGVMLTVNNLTGNVCYALDMENPDNGDHYFRKAARCCLFIRHFVKKRKRNFCSFSRHALLDVYIKVCAGKDLNLVTFFRIDQIVHQLNILQYALQSKAVFCQDIPLLLEVVSVFLDAGV
jgi:long-chain acyl-CoA synthetase